MTEPFALSAALAVQIDYNLGALRLNTDGVPHADSVRIPAAAGNSLNWVVGHLARARTTLLKLVGDQAPLGEAALWSRVEAAPYGRSESLPAGDPEGVAVELEALVAVFAEAQDRLHRGFAAIPADALAAPAPFSPRGKEDETIGGLLAGLVFHEAYHVGQTGLLRRQLGFPGKIA